MFIKQGEGGIILATRDELYRKFGLAAEAAQLFETELSSLLLGAKGLENGWHIEPDPESTRKTLNQIDRHTLGKLLSELRLIVDFEDNLADRYVSALNARNRLTHGFFERHNFKIQTDDGRDEMIVDLETLHQELFIAWQITSTITKAMVEIISEKKVTGVKLSIKNLRVDLSES